MGVYLENSNYLTKWTNYTINYYEGYKLDMFNFHMHDYYEINLILSGNVKIHLTDVVQEGSNSRIALARPKTPHFVTIDEHTLYKRYNLLFSESFIADYLPEWKQISTVFGKNGNIINISDKQANQIANIIKALSEETNQFRQKLMIYCILSLILDFSKKDETVFDKVPVYIINALSYIDEHYHEKITASNLAWMLGISRTTLMTAFKKYTGSTLNDYILQRRLKRAIQLLRAGKTSQETAELCGFGGTYGLIRNFHRFYNMTPKQYIAYENNQKD